MGLKIFAQAASTVQKANPCFLRHVLRCRFSNVWRVWLCHRSSNDIICCSSHHGVRSHDHLCGSHNLRGSNYYLCSSHYVCRTYHIICSPSHQNYFHNTCKEGRCQEDCKDCQKEGKEGRLLPLSRKMGWSLLMSRDIILSLNSSSILF